MNIEEAKEVVYNMEIDENSISCKNCVLENREHCVVNRQDCQMEAIYTVLNELDKKDKVIDMMAEWLYNDDSSFGLFELREVNTPEKIKEYFYNKLESN